MMAPLKDLKNYLEKYPNKHPDVITQYGTSGFRKKADSLFHVTFRTGILAGLRSRVVKGVIGVMITASHNPEEDNGLKIIETDGSMLEQSWEELATKMANVPDEQLERLVLELIQRFNLRMDEPCRIYMAKDTRKSSQPLSEALKDGIKCFGGEFVDFNLLTTPQLHYIVRCVNFPGDYGEPSEEGYYRKLSNAFNRLTENGSTEKLHLVIDCANGVGAIKMQAMDDYIKDRIQIELVNTGDGILNHKCGADYVKVNQRQPDSIELEFFKHYASFDGDADRVVFYYKNLKDGKFHLLDGDKIAVLVAKFLDKTLKDAGLDQIKITVVQTAYANGNSTKYIQETLKMTTDCVPTGVKYLHHRAQQAEIGIYFEANGHGTILFSENTQKQIAHHKYAGDPGRKVMSFLDSVKLINFIDLVNQTVGDAISDALVVEMILNDLGLTIDQWDSFYTDLPNKLLKVAVKDRNVIVTTDAERKCLKPEGLQEAIDKTVAEFGPQARSFIRPSGTEDVVRIYAEASTQELADNLAKKVANLVYEFANGIGSKF